MVYYFTDKQRRYEGCELVVLYVVLLWFFYALISFTADLIGDDFLSVALWLLPYGQIVNVGYAIRSDIEDIVNENVEVFVIGKIGGQ